MMIRPTARVTSVSSAQTASSVVACADIYSPFHFAIRLGTKTFLAILIIALLSVFASAQIPAPTVPDNGPTTISPLGIPPGTGADGTNESVSYTNGSVNMFIPLLSLPQRGGYPFTLGFTHHSNAYSPYQQIFISSTIDTSEGTGIAIDHIAYSDSMQIFDNFLEINLPRLRYGMEYVGDHAYKGSSGVTQNVNMFCESNFIFTDSAGNGHPFENQTNCNSVHASDHSIIAEITDSSDGSLYRLDTTNKADMKVISKDGTVYHFYGDSVYCPGASTNGNDCTFTQSYPNWRDTRTGLIVDPNGNQISITRTINAQNQNVYSVTDTIGRLITISPTAISYKDSNGQPQQIAVTTTQSSQMTSSSNGLSCAYEGQRVQLPYLNPTLTSSSVWGGPTSTNISIALPASNGAGSKTYNMQFYSERRLTTIQYPAGGYTSYNYSDTTPGAMNYGGAHYIGLVNCSYALPEVVSKSECRSSSGSCSAPDVTSYNATITSSDSSTGEGPYNSSFTVTRPLGDYETHEFSDLNEFRTNVQETDALYFSATGAPLKTIHKDYPSNSIAGAGYLYDVTIPSKVTTTLNDVTPVQSRYVSYQYENYTSLLGFSGSSVYIDNPTNIIETDYDGTPKRTTVQQWIPAGGFSSNGHILDKLMSKTVTDNSIVNGLQRSEVYEYDLGSNTVGNLTKVTVSGKSTATAITKYARNSYGQITQITDPRLNLTLISYDDTNGWADRTCAPSPGSSAYPTLITNALGQKVSYQYNSCTGTIASVTGPNTNQTTSYTYDALQRVTTAHLPDSGGKEACYFDSIPNSVTTYELQNSSASLPSCSTPTATASGNIVHSSVFDGLGRGIQSQLLSDPSGVILTDTTYDSNDNLYSVSNPYRSTTESSYGLTTYEYDGLNRKVLETNQFNHARSWAYAGSTVTFTNELGNQWEHVSDAFGRLTKVLEPNGLSPAPSMETDYSYDGFGNLRGVTQAPGSSSTVTRSFLYDDYSRLLTSTNPEIGTSSYTYDLNGNLLTKTEPAVNATSGTLQLGYCYDVLNRLVGKWSSAPPSGCNSTPTSLTSTLLDTYTYLQSASSSYPNAVGDLIDEKAYLNSVLVSERTPQSYDLVGRILTEAQAPYSPSGSQFTFNSVYDRAGELTSDSNSSTGIVIGYGYDSAGRLGGITSSLTSSGSTSYPATLYSVNSYGPAGLTQATYAGDPNNTGFFNLFRYYDAKGRVVDNEVYSLTDGFGKATVTIAGSEMAGDAGTIGISAGITQVVHYGAGSTVQSISANLATSFNHNNGSTVTATVGNASPNTTGPGACVGGSVPGTSPVVPCAVITLTAIEFGHYGNVALSTTDVDSNNSTSPSFTATASGIALSGGVGTPQGGAYAYVYTVYYDGVGNVTHTRDAFNGEWSNTYDTLNRLTGTAYYASEGTGVVTPNGIFSNQCWAYDAFGNRTNELESNSACPTSLTSGTSTHWATYNTANRISGSDTLATGPGYDAAGNVTQDAINRYVYDVEGRVCAVQNLLASTATQYVYDAEGRRVAKGTITSWPAAGSVCAAPTSANGFTLTATYLRGTSGAQDTEIDAPTSGSPTGSWHQNVYADGGLLATYTGLDGTPPALYFSFNDWLGTKRLQVNAAGQATNWWSSDPFGDYQHQNGSSPDATEQHFTGKERDTESGNDYFGARYYASSMGRFMSPDWSVKAEPVPYAKLDDPQTLNLYAYVGNNPLSRTDADGHSISHAFDGLFSEGAGGDDPEPKDKKPEAPAQQGSQTQAQQQNSLGNPPTPPAPVFQNQTDAAMNAAAGISGAVQSTGWEWGAALYKTSDGMVGITPLRTDHDPGSVGTTDFYTGKDIPAGATRIGDVHGHTGINSPDKGMHMSPGDLGTAGTMLKAHGTETKYMVNPQGQVWKFNPATDAKPVLLPGRIQ